MTKGRHHRVLYKLPMIADHIRASIADLRVSVCVDCGRAVAFGVWYDVRMVRFDVRSVDHVGPSFPRVRSQ
jgi:hypothetical protein